MRIDAAHIDAERACSSNRPLSRMGEVDAIRSIAAAQANHCALAVLAVVDQALARGERGVLIDQWIAVLRDAVLSDRRDAQAAGIYAAACAVRLAG